MGIHIDLSKIEYYLLDLNRLTCDKSDIQFMKIANIGGKSRFVPIHGTKRYENKIPVFIDDENKSLYTYAEFYERDYYIGAQPMEYYCGVCGILEDVYRFGEEWTTYPTSEYDNDEIIYEYHSVKRLPVSLFI